MKHLYDVQSPREFTQLLSPHDVGFITALAQDVTVTEKNIAAIESGFFSAPNRDWMESELQKVQVIGSNPPFTHLKKVPNLGAKRWTKSRKD